MLQIVEEHIVDGEGNNVVQYRVIREDGTNIEIEWAFENMEMAEAFVEQYDGKCIYSFITDQILDHVDLGVDTKAPNIPAKGSLDIKAVLQSDYCFA